MANLKTNKLKLVEEEFFPEIKTQSRDNVLFYDSPSCLGSEKSKKFVKSSVTKSCASPVSTEIHEPIVSINCDNENEDKMILEDIILNDDRSSIITDCLSKIRDYEQRIARYKTKIERLKRRVYL